MTVSQADKAKKFRALHEAPGSFVIPNPWDGGSARGEGRTIKAAEAAAAQLALLQMEAQ